MAVKLKTVKSEITLTGKTQANVLLWSAAVKSESNLHETPDSWAPQLDDPLSWGTG